MVARFLLTVLFLLVPATILAPSVSAQGTDTVYDEAGVLSDSEEQQVQEAYNQTEEEAGQPLYAFLVPDTGVESQEARRKLLEQEANEENVPQDAGVIVVAPNDGWAQLANIDGTSEQAVYAAMVPDFRSGDYAAGLVEGAEEIRGEPAASQSDPNAGGSPAGGILLLLAVLAGAALLLRNRRRNRQRLEGERRAAEEEFANLTSRINEFDEKERLVGGYL
ncbi:MAG TPA: TPM domain-containing protein, partial [Rubrobacteraceae bacterium]|nr:TPM domain-containing protein [Rubrobacteraceae bacterium]